MKQWDRPQLRQVWKNRQIGVTERPVGELVNNFVRKVVAPRQKKLQQLAAAWQDLLPAELTEHSCLETLSRGRLRVLVDSASHLAELDLLFKEGMLEALRQRCPSVSLGEVRLLRGRWYREDEQGNKIVDYSQAVRSGGTASRRRRGRYPNRF